MGVGVGGVAILNASRNPTSPSSASYCAKVPNIAPKMEQKWGQDGVTEWAGGVTRSVKNCCLWIAMLIMWLVPTVL